MVALLLGSVAFVMTYVTASVFFWRNPQLLHRKKRVSFSAVHISHRGGSAEGYENTLKNFQKAVEKGTNMLELDVRLTKDGQVVVHHDPDLKRLTGSALKVSEVDYSQLPPIKPVVPIDTIPGQTFSDPSWSEEERRIPLLSQVFAQFPKVPINIDLKDDDEQLVIKVANLIEEYQRADITVWGSFSDKICKLCYEINPDVRLFFSAKRALLLCLFAITGILPYVPLKETHYEVLLPSAVKRRLLRTKDSLTFVERLLLWLSNVLLVGRPLTNHLRKRGIHVYLWVCNTDEEFDECFRRGANGIMTDYPTKLREYLDAHPAQKSEL